MILIWGFKVRFTRTTPIVFFCPTCGGDRAGHRGHLRRWFTFFWIPIIPTKVVGEFVQCDTCQTRFQPTVLDRPTTAVLTESLANAVRVLTALIVRGGPAEDPALRAAAVCDIAVAVPGYDDAALAHDLTLVDPGTAAQYVAPLADGLEVAGKERFIADLTRVALTGGIITSEQRWLLDAAGRGLGLTPAHVTGVIASATAERSPTDPPGT